MQRPPSIPELTVINRFIRQAVTTGIVYAVSDGGKIVSVSSPRNKLLLTGLLWTVHGEAERWAPVLAARPSVKAYTLGELAETIVPQLAMGGHFVGLDWSAEPIEPEMEPMELLGRLQAKALESFLHALKGTRTLWIIEDSSGAVVQPSAHDREGLALPCFARREEAEHRLADCPGSWIADIDVENFVAVTAPWLAAQGWTVAPGTWRGAGAPELQANDLAGRWGGTWAA